MRGLASFLMFDPWLPSNPPSSSFSHPIRKPLAPEGKFKPHKPRETLVPAPNPSHLSLLLFMSLWMVLLTWVINIFLPSWCMCDIIILRIWIKLSKELIPPSTGPPRYSWCCKQDSLGDDHHHLAIFVLSYLASKLDHLSAANTHSELLSAN